MTISIIYNLMLFSVSQELEVVVTKRIERRITGVGSSPATPRPHGGGMSSVQDDQVRVSSPPPVIVARKSSPLTPSSDETSKGISCDKLPEKYFTYADRGCRNQEEWLDKLSRNFRKIVSDGEISVWNVLEPFFIVLGLEAAKREGIMTKIKEGSKLLPKQNQDVIHSLNYAVKQQFGARRPSKDLCRYLVTICCWFT